MSHLFSRTDKSFLGRWWWTVDRGLLTAFLILMVFGVVLVTTASPAVAEHLGIGSYHFLIRHLIMLVPSILLLVGLSMLEPRHIWRLSSVVFVFCIIALVVVLFAGVEIKGARRWIHFLGFSLQPSEFIKPAFAIVGAWFIAVHKKRENFPGYAITAGLYALVVALLILQPDFGMTFVVSVIWMTHVFLAGLRFRLLFVLAGLGVAGVAVAYMSLDHVQSRIDRFLDPESGDNYQVEKSLEAFQNGGILGTGPGQGTVKENLPDAHADFIFSVAGEEMGLVFVLVIICVFGFILVRGFNRLMDSEDMFVVLAVGSLLTMFGLQALVHMGSALSVLPAKGMTLPFISYGGSSLLALGYAMGAVLGLTRRQGRFCVSRGGVSSGPREARVPG